MNELIEKLVKEAGLTEQQAQQAITTIAGFAIDEFPMLGGAPAQIFAAGNKNEE